MPYQTTIGNLVYRFADLKTLLAKASPARSGDYLAGLAAATYEERMAAKLALVRAITAAGAHRSGRRVSSRHPCTGGSVANLRKLKRVLLCGL